MDNQIICKLETSWNERSINLTYHQEGDYLIPDFTLPAPPNIGVWGERRRQYLLKNRKPLYTAMLLSSKLNAHLEEVDRSANDMMERLTKQIAEREGVTEFLKACDQMAWVGAMSSIRARAEDPSGPALPDCAFFCCS